MVTEKLHNVEAVGSKRSKEVPSVRIELTTLGLLDPRSNQLSYEGIFLLEWLSRFMMAAKIN